MRLQQNRRSGAALVLVAVSLVALLGILALTVDMGLLYGEKRRAHAGADAAAMAGAIDLFKNWESNAGADTGGTAKSNALTIASANGYSNDGTTSIVDARVYGQTYRGGPNVGKPIPKGYIEVTIISQNTRFFSNILGSGNIPVAARAVARGRWTIPKWGILVLDPTGRAAFNMTGQGTVNVSSGTVQVNSTDSEGTVLTNNGYLETSELDMTGGAVLNGTIITDPPDNVNYNTPPVSDPLASLPPPSVPPAGTITTLTSSDPKVQALLTSPLLSATAIQNLQTLLGNSNTKISLLTPGLYSKKLQFQSTDLVIFQQASAGSGGIYYLDSGLYSQGASLVMDVTTSGGLMLYNAGTGTSDSISITGSPSGVVYLSGLTSGPYEGLVIYQNRLATEPISITGNGDFNMFGSIYAANATLNLAGNGASQTIGSQLIARDVNLSGNGVLNVNMASGPVAPTRQLNLVE